MADKRIVIELFSGSGKYKGYLKIFQPHFCGGESRDYRGNVLEQTICDECTSHREFHEYGGGRYGIGYCLHPSHYGGARVRPVVLTSPETQDARMQIRAMGLDDSDWIIAHTGHGAWKIRKNNGIVIIAENDGVRL